MPGRKIQINKQIKLALFTLVFFSCSQNINSIQQPQAAAGVIDLRSWDFELHGSVDLNGEWQLFQQKLVFPGDAEVQPDGFVSVPYDWRNSEINGKKQDIYGYASYKLKVILPENITGKKMIFGFSGDRDVPVRLFLDNELILQDGKVGISKEESIPSNFPAISEPLSLNKEVILVLQTSNFHYRTGGFSEISLGSYKQVINNKEANSRSEMFLAGALLIMALYHLTLFIFRRNDLSPLFFGLFSLVVTTRLMLTGERFLVGIFPDLPWQFFLGLEYIGYYLSVPLFALFVRSLFPDEMKFLAVKIISVTTSLFLVTVFIFPTTINTRIMNYFHIVSIGGSLYTFYAVILAVYKKRESAVIFLAGWLFVFGTMVNDILYYEHVIHTGTFVALGLFVFIFMQTAILSRRFTNAFFTVEALSGELEKRNIHLEQIDKLKDEFLSNTSHELKTPLNGIMGLADTLLQGSAGELGEKAARNLGMILSSSKRLANLINDILDFSKLKNHDISLAVKPVNLYNITEFVVAVNSILIRNQDLKLINKVPSDIVVQADENRLEQILQNVIGNAIKFTERGEVTVSAWLENQSVKIVIADTGPGIAAERLESIFNSFEQADASIERKFGGTGLGLSITRQLVELHGGEIHAISKPGKGSEFHIILPAASGTEENSKVHGRIISDLPMQLEMGDLSRFKRTDGFVEGKTILVVDDEPINLHVTADLLELRGFTTIEAMSGVEALEIIDNKKPDLVILDIMMPGMNGFDVCRRIREKYNSLDLPVLFLTAKNLVEDLVVGLECGANDFLAKPFSSHELSARIGNLGSLVEIHKKEIGLIKQLREKEKLAGIGLLAAGIVHDFMNPLIAIREFSRMILRNPVMEERNKFIECIHADSSRAITLAQNILDLSHGNIRLQILPVNSSEFLENTINTMYPVFQKNEITIKHQDDYRKDLYIDKDRFLRVMINLIGNAVESGGKGLGINIRIYEKENSSVIEISDNGPGIPETIRENLFEIFVTEGKKEGSGIGLSVSKNIVEAHGGTISFETAKGQGTTFTITLPLLEI